MRPAMDDCKKVIWVTAVADCTVTERYPKCQFLHVLREKHSFIVNIDTLCLSLIFWKMLKQSSENELCTTVLLTTGKGRNDQVT